MAKFKVQIKRLKAISAAVLRSCSAAVKDGAAVLRSSSAAVKDGAAVLQCCGAAVPL